MRRRAKRDLTILVGVIFLVCVAVFLNYEYGRGEKVEYYTEYRQKVEEERLAKGADLLSWSNITSTPWTRGEGPEFQPELRERDEERIDIIGFMTPIDRYRKMTEFLLLPLPIECYFCQMPPREHVILVTMAEGATTDRYKEPMLVTGRLELNESADSRFFYQVADATVAAGEEGGSLTKWHIDPEHFTPEHMKLKEEPELHEGFSVQ
ncbi:MAG: DUF3299 domain-containing protein [Candidatus Hydrogenedentota bacterium]